MLSSLLAFSPSGVVRANRRSISPKGTLYEIQSQNLRQQINLLLFDLRKAVGWLEVKQNLLAKRYNTSRSEQTKRFHVTLLFIPQKQNIQ
jgi:hypothetical protein